jgi:hypothetical protein
MTELQKQMARIVANVEMHADAVSEAKSIDEMREALRRLTNVSLRLGYAAHILTGDSPDTSSAASFISAVEADGGANGYIIGGKP